MIELIEMKTKTVPMKRWLVSVAFPLTQVGRAPDGPVALDIPLSPGACRMILSEISCLVVSVISSISTLLARTIHCLVRHQHALSTCPYVYAH